MNKLNLQNQAKISKILRDSLALRLNVSELERLLILLKILKINLKKAQSVLFWRHFYKENPSIFDFILERS